MYKDKLAEAKDIDVFDKALKEILKKTFDDIFIESSTLKSPLIYCHFAKGIGEPKYMPVTSWDALVKLLMDALKVTVSWHDLYLTINCFRATMSSTQSWTLSSLRMQCLMCAASIESLRYISSTNIFTNCELQCPRGNALLIGVGGSGKQSLSRLAAYISSMEVFQVVVKKDIPMPDLQHYQITLRKGYGIPDLKTDMSNLYQKTGLKNLPTAFLMSDAQVADEKFLVLINNLLASGEIPDLFAEDEVGEYTFPACCIEQYSLSF